MYKKDGKRRAKIEKKEKEVKTYPDNQAEETKKETRDDWENYKN